MPDLRPLWLSALENWFRKQIHDPEDILSPYIEEGTTVLDVGCGSGHFALAMAKMVGEKGKVIAADVQWDMLERVKETGERENLESRILIHKCESDKLKINNKVDFALAFYMVHEVAHVDEFMKDMVTLIKPKGKFLVVEPKIHVSVSSTGNTLKAAKSAGFKLISEPKIRFSRSMLFELE